MALTKVTYSMIDGAAVNVLDYGVVADGVTNNSAALAAALAAVPANGTLYFPAGVYCGYLLIRRSNITIMGAGSASTTLKLPNNCPSITVPHDGVPNPITGLPNVIEIGECALGNTANTYSRVNVVGLTIDGNYSNNTAPTTDLFGHGIILTKTSNCVIGDVVAQNCYLTGVDNVINSNYNNINVTVIDCGNALVSGAYYPNFDVNSSKYCSFNVISKQGKYGGRLLDNCWGNTFTITSYSPAYTGFTYNNQPANFSYSNIINATVIDGCGLGQGVYVGENCVSSILNLTVYSAAANGVTVSGGATTPATGNTFNIATYQNGGPGVYADANSKFNRYNITSNEDGRSGSPGTYFAIEFDGSDSNQINAVIKEGASSQVRGLVFRSGANNNALMNLTFDTNLVQAVNDLGSGNYINWASGSPTSATASATSIDVPFSGSLFDISGTTTIVTLSNSNTYKGRVITLQFQGSLTVQQKSATPGSNIVLAGSTNFSATASDTLTLISNGTDWVEIARTVI